MREFMKNAAIDLCITATMFAIMLGAMALFHMDPIALVEDTVYRIGQMLNGIAP